ncbi:MAG: DUF4190 domain-containing protein [Phycisphaerales bacterium]
MTQFGSQFGDDDPGELKTSGLAIGSLVCSLICCVPVTTIPGILLGIAAMISIGNNPARKGKGLAVAGILLGVIFTSGQVYVYPRLIEFVGDSYELVMGGPTSALTDGFTDDPVAFKTHFYGTGARATDTEAQTFIDTLRSRYGEFQSCRFNEQVKTSPAFGKPTAVFPYIFTFDNATLDGDAQIIWVDERTGEKIFKFSWVTIRDPDLGNLRYPPKKIPGTPPDAPDAPQPADTTQPADDASSTPAGGPDEGDGG